MDEQQRDIASTVNLLTLQYITAIMARVERERVRSELNGMMSEGLWVQYEERIATLQGARAIIEEYQ